MFNKLVNLSRINKQLIMILVDSILLAYGRLERGEIATVSIKTVDIVLSALGYEIDIKGKEAFGIPVLDS